MSRESDDQNLVYNRLAKDLIGPTQVDEKLTSRPSDCYLTGILWPMATRMEGEDDEMLGIASSDSGSDDDREKEAIHSRSLRKPSVAGLSFCVYSDSIPYVEVAVEFATYYPERTKEKKTTWSRRQHSIAKKVDLSNSNPIEIYSDERDGVVMNIKLDVRSMKVKETNLVTLTIVNQSRAKPNTRQNNESATTFQVSMRVVACDDTFLIPKPRRVETFETTSTVNGKSNDDISDEESSALLYRNVVEYAVGHVCSAEWEQSSSKHRDGEPTADSVSTTWIPSSFVYPVNAFGHQLLRKTIRDKNLFENLSASAISMETPSNLNHGLLSFCNAYEQWLNMQRERLDSSSDISPELRPIAVSNLQRCENTLARLKGSVTAISNDQKLRRAFQLANFVMDIQYKWSHGIAKRLEWRPFQLAFLLLSAPSTVDRNHLDREYMDLLWFPTGGGKTEAYLALIACLAIYRRLSNDPRDHRGVYALMRYTLRLLTTQQFARASAVIVALEAIRTGRIPAPDGLTLKGTDSFSIGLWVGNEATPNKREDAHESGSGNTNISSPEQLSECPCCHKKLAWKFENLNSHIVPECNNMACDVHGILPVYTVDEDIYDIRPTLLIGTTDKFAQIIREKLTGKLFGVPDKSPPDLILQDELHLISGPLGTIAGAYETAFDLMFMRDNKRVKIVGSTATIRMASEQVRALFDRKAFQFPPSAIDHDDSGFAVVDKSNRTKPRRYLSVSTAGRSAKFVVQSVSGSLLQTAYAEFTDSARKDAYWTLVGYFNSLRELGGALVLMRDDVTDSINVYAQRRGEKARTHPYVEELTSRRTQNEILQMLQGLNIPRDKAGAIDAVLATNMISVGVDIPRLGLMLVIGQPKSMAEYIQSTSRVGRADVPGVIVSILNNAKARDRSHFETFNSWHMALYKDVETTSVTPFASRARDRALHAALVIAIRHLVPNMIDKPSLSNEHDEQIGEIVNFIVDRAKRIDPEEKDVRRELELLLEKWKIMGPSYYWKHAETSESLLQSAEHAATRSAVGLAGSSAWPTLNSMRTVEPATPFRMAPGLREQEANNGE